MESADIERLWEMANKISIIVSLGTFVFSIIIWFLLKKQQKKMKILGYTTPPIKDYKTDFEKYTTLQTDNPFALCISLLSTTHSIKSVVKKYLKLNNLKIRDKNIIELAMDGIDGTEAIENYLTQLRELRRGELSDATEIRLFIAGPVQAGTMAGAILDNWVPVLMYHKGRIHYEYWGPLLKS